jgi:arylsulfate sulfotransferase
MKKAKKFLLYLLTLSTVVCLSYFSGVYVKPNIFTESSIEEVEQYDVLTWQKARENEILNDYNAGSYTIQSPYIIVDPYDMNPLSALVMFNSTGDTDYTITVLAKHNYANFVTSVKTSNGRVEIPIIGLFAGSENVVLLDSANNHAELHITTEVLPYDFQTIKLIAAKPAEMEPGFTLFIACFDHSYTALVDQDGAVRAYLSNSKMAHGTTIIQLKNGHFLSTGDETRQVPYNMTSLWEFNWLGKIFQEFEVPNGIHHDISELPNGDILAVSNNLHMFESGTREDVVIVIDRLTGLVKTEYDFRGILDEHRSPYTNFHPNILNPINIDWMHINSAFFDPEHNWLIVSSPVQSQIVAIDVETKEIQWILGPHEGYDGSSAYLSSFLLEPVGVNFQWQWAQHHPILLPDVDNNSNTMDILLFDNGQVKSFTQDHSISPEDNTSRAVHYRIDLNNRTVEQVWEYGKERGNELYSTFLGNADFMEKTGNVLIAFGGQLKEDGVSVDKILDGVLGKITIQSTVVEVNKNNEVVYEIKVLSNDFTTSAETYQARRFDFTTFTTISNLSETKAERHGIFQFSLVDNETNIPNIYLGDINAVFNKLTNENGRLIIDGILFYKGKSYLLGQAVIVLRSFTKTYVFSSNSGLNGRFFSSIDLSTLDKGNYEISIAAGVKEGNDVQKGTIHKGYFTTHYKIVVD